MKFNKGAMFGLCRALKKESGRLFLASRQSVDSLEKRDRFKTNRGAMFGLDARIALAIFGALSVISGAALYSTIQDSKATAYLVNLQEVGKAWEQYYLDTGQSLPRHHADNTNPHYYLLENKFLVENHSPALSGWNGPYLSHSVLNYHLYDDNIKEIYMATLTDETNWGDTVGWGSGTCTSGKNCYVWVHTATQDKSLVDALDKKIDGALDATAGSLKWSDAASSGNYSIFFKYAAIKNPNS